MLRLFATQACNVFRNCSRFSASYGTKRQMSGFLLVHSSCHHRVSVLSRPFSTGTSPGKDVLHIEEDESKDKETLDLDGWKSVMRSQAAFESKQVSSEAEASDDGENLKEPRGDLSEAASLEAIRDLVWMWQQAGKQVPQEITDEELQTLAKLTTKSASKKYLKYLAQKENHKLTRKVKQQQKKAEREAWMKEKREREGDAEEAQELKNTFVLQFWNRTLDNLLAWRSAQAMLFGQPLVFDMSYESNMSRRELENTVSQLQDVEAWNRRATDPYHLHFCNLQPDGGYMKELLKQYGAETWERIFITGTDRPHIDVFPREQLVYLTADSPNVLRTFDHSKVYIIGALVDRSIQSGLALANAKRLNLATARLPLDEHLHWEIGTKNLTLDQMICIMLTLKETGNWEEALKFVPQRKHDGFHPKQAQKKRIRKGFNGRPQEDGDRLKTSVKTFKSQSFYKSQKEVEFTRRDRTSGLASDRKNTPAATKVRTSSKSTMEGRKRAGKSKIWGHDE
ncbi:tRNA methyltransferase 10 homolog C [Mugil cephalus]|uniref:tRNA methyltransferase 10 homolog C n=1 Tax=Mugil cephalus TaxID=48193 RepID=UPI001FB79DA1|nr:tRNA methyltransferase 10 homolog C [Mugil cephalus]